jgi:peptide/nickel transport system permease protein
MENTENLRQVSGKQKSGMSAMLDRVWSFCREQPLGAIGAVLLFALIVIALGAPLLAPKDPISTAITHTLAPPSSSNWFGTDFMGRDLFSRWLYGARMSLLVAICSVALSSVLGGFLGIFCGLVGGKTDSIIQRVMDVMMAMPGIVIAILIMAILGTSALNLIIAIAVSYAPRVNRLTRGVAVSIKESLFVESATVAGASKLRITLRHIAPNCIAPWIVYASALLAIAFLSEASLSFLGLGIPRPEPSWGRDLSDNMNNFQFAPWLAIFPGLGICMAIFGANFLGDALRNLLDPRLKKV